MEGVPDLRRGLLCTNSGGLTGAMDWRFTVYLQLSICGLSMARPPNLLICIFFLGDTGDGDALLSPSPSSGGYWSQLIQHPDQLDSGSKPRLEVGGWELWFELVALLLSRPRCLTKTEQCCCGSRFKSCCMAPFDMRMRVTPAPALS